MVTHVDDRVNTHSQFQQQQTQSEEVSVQTQQDPSRPVRFVGSCAKLRFLLYLLGFVRCFK